MPVTLPPTSLRRAGPRCRASAAGAGLLLSVLALAGCDTAGGGPEAGDRPLAAESEPLHRLGTYGGDRWDAFSRVASVAFDREGRLHILDADARRVVVAGPDGTHLRSFGQRGEGPGEFRVPTALTVLDDGTVVVFDAGHGSFLLFDEEGAFLGSRPVGIDGDRPGTELHPHGEDGVVSVNRGFVIRAAPGSPPAFPATAPVVRFDLSDRDRPAARLYEAWLPAREAPTPVSVNPSGPGGGIRMGGGPSIRAFEPEPRLAAFPDGRLALVDSTTYRIRLLSPYGEEVGKVTREVSPRPVGEAEERAEKERRLKELDEGRGPRMQIVVGGPGGPMSFDETQMQDLLRSRIEDMAFWPEIPVVTRLAADRDGRLWVARSGGVDGAGPVDLFDPVGRYLGTVPDPEFRIPDAFGPDGLAAWIEQDELDVPHVVIGRIRVPGS